MQSIDPSLQLEGVSCGDRLDRWPLVICGLLSAIVVWLYSSRLIGSPDSLSYFVAARSLGRGDGLVDVSGAPFTQYAPLYSIVLAAVSKLGLGLFDAARAVNAVAVGASVIVAGSWIRLVARSRSIAVAGGLLAVALPLGYWSRSALSEPLFVLLVLVSGWQLSAGILRSSHRRLALAGTLLGLAIATRYSGFFLLPVALVPALGWPGPLRSRMAAAAWFGAPALTVGLLPVLRNLLIDPAEPLGPRVAGNNSALSAVSEALVGTGRWVTPAVLPWWSGLAGVGGLVALMAFAWHTTWSRSSRRRRFSAVVPLALSGLYVTGMTYSAMTTNIDSLGSRLLAPAGVLWLVGAIAVIWFWLTSSGFGRALERHQALLLTAPLAALAVASVALLVSSGSAQRDVPASDNALRSEMLRSPTILEAADEEAALFSNNPWAAAYSLDTPVKFAPMNRYWGSSANIQSPLEELAQVSARVPTILIWLRSYESATPYMVPLEEIQEHCRTIPLDSNDDGELLRVMGCDMDS